MERKIGEIFEFGREWYQCVEDENEGCEQCDLSNLCPYDRSFADNVGNCTKKNRSDGKSIIFKKLERVGEPYSYYFPNGRIIYFQRYECYQEPIIEGDIIWHWVDPTWVGIEIKQNKENNMEEKKLNLKPFDIQKAREGKPVCTRDGRSVRIICFDYNGEDRDYPIVALVSYNKGNNCYERILKYTSYGLFNKYEDYEHDNDLMMLPEKKEGWINVYKGFTQPFASVYPRIYKSKEEAINDKPAERRIDTIKIEWEE